MRRLLLVTGGVVALLAGAGLQEARAQFQPPGLSGFAGFQTQQFRRPPVSPYINLAQPGFNPGITYYGIVRPELNFQQRLQNLQGQLTTVEQQQAVLTSQAFAGGEIAPTGLQPAGFQTQGVYFFNNYYPVGGRGGARPGTGAASGQPFARQQQQQPTRRGGR
jgi:hypothetical protein